MGRSVVRTGRMEESVRGKGSAQGLRRSAPGRRGATPGHRARGRSATQVPRPPGRIGSGPALPIRPRRGRAGGPGQEGRGHRPRARRERDDPRVRVVRLGDPDRPGGIPRREPVGARVPIRRPPPGGRRPRPWCPIPAQGRPRRLARGAGQHGQRRQETHDPGQDARTPAGQTRPPIGNRSPLDPGPTRRDGEPGPNAARRVGSPFPRAATAVTAPKKS